MEIQNYIDDLEKTLKEFSDYEKKGLDTSSLRLFIKNLKVFQKIQFSRENKFNRNITFKVKLELIKAFLDDKKVFPRINEIIEFANNELGLEFKNQKESRGITIQRIIGRIEKNPELKEKVKKSVIKIRNKRVHPHSSYKTKKDIENVESYTKWAKILSNL